MIPTVFDDTSAISTATVTVIEPTITVNKKVSVSGGAYVDNAFAQANDTLQLPDRRDQHGHRARV